MVAIAIMRGTEESAIPRIRRSERSIAEKVRRSKAVVVRVAVVAMGEVSRRLHGRDVGPGGRAREGCESEDERGERGGVGEARVDGSRGRERGSGEVQEH